MVLSSVLNQGTRLFRSPNVLSGAVKAAASASVSASANGHSASVGSSGSRQHNYQQQQSQQHYHVFRGASTSGRPIILVGNQRRSFWDWSGAGKGNGNEGGAGDAKGAGPGGDGGGRRDRKGSRPGGSASEFSSSPCRLIVTGDTGCCEFVSLSSTVSKCCISQQYLSTCVTGHA